MNKVAFITGGTSGIGRELGKLCSNGGYDVYAVGLDPNPLDENEYFCDVTNFTELNEAVGKLEKIDLLVCSAGFGISGALELSDHKLTKKLFDVNYFGVLNTIKVCLPKMSKNSKIVIIGSCCGLFALPFRANYCASKAAVNMLGKGLKMELSRSGIDVCVINPGDVKTPFVNNRIKNFETNERYEGRVKKAQDIVDGRNDRRMSVKTCANKIFRICRRKKLRSSYIIGFKFKCLNILSKLLPENLFIKLTNKFFGGM